MATEPIKLRCGRCQQRLGAPPSKAGSRVSCPKCGAEVLVPSRDSSPAFPQVRLGDGAEAASYSNDDGVSADILEIRPEDIRAEGGSAAFRPAPSPFPSLPSAPKQSPGPGPYGAVEIAIDFDARPDAPPKDAVPLPAIRLEDAASPPRSVRPPAARPTDLVLPRTVVAAWSLLVLLAVAFAFLAGLLAGHYLWRAH